MTGLEVAALAAVAIGTAVSAVSSISQGIAAREMGDYNARVAEVDAQSAEASSRAEAEASRKRTARLQGAVRARAAASGLDLGEGSPLEVLYANASEGELEALSIEHSGATAASRYRSQGAVARARGRQAETSGYLSAASQVLSSAVSAYKLYGGAGTTDTGGAGTLQRGWGPAYGDTY